MAAERCEIFLRVFKNISQVSAANEVNIFQHEKRNCVSPSNHVMFCLLYKYQLYKYHSESATAKSANHCVTIIMVTDIFTCEDNNFVIFMCEDMKFLCEGFPGISLVFI